MPDADVHREARRRQKAVRNANRRLLFVDTVPWQFPEYRRCTACGRWCSEAQLTGADFRSGLRWCEPCFVSAELRRASVRARLLPMPPLHTTVVTGAA